MRLQFVCFYIMALLLALFCWVQQGAAQFDDTVVISDCSKTKQRFPVWDDAQGEWTLQDN